MKSPEKVKRYYTDSDIEISGTYPKPENLEELPGMYPFTRGVQPDMYRSKLWTMRQYAGFSTAEESNKRYKFLLKSGITGLSVAFDLPTQMGYDSGHPLADGEVGKAGVAIDSLKDMEVLFEGIPVQTVSTSMTINATASILLAMYIALAKKQGADLSLLRGTIQNDILKEYAARGTYIYPPEPSMRIITDIFEYCSKEIPKWNTISVSGYHIREAGSTAVQELAFTLSNGKQYLIAAMNKGLDINDFAKRMSFFFNSHNNMFQEIAKFRAARRLWANMTKEMGATDPKAQMLRFHTQTGGSTLTAQQPLNNISRVTIQALSAVLGGTQSLHTNGYDEALGLPTELAAETALRTQQIIAYESGVSETVDPLAGSYFIESLTNEVEAKAKEYIDKIDTMGGAIKAIENGFMQNEISSASYKYQKRIEKNEQIVVGLNKFPSKEEQKADIFTVDENIRNIQILKNTELKKKRNSELVADNLKKLEIAATNGSNLMPVILTAVEGYATVGEISDVFRSVFGEY